MIRRNAALIVLYDNNHRMLLQHRDNNAPWLPNSWAFFGGGIEYGESAEEAVSYAEGILKWCRKKIQI